MRCEISDPRRRFVSGLFQLLVPLVLCAGCATEYRVALYNNAGRSVVLQIDGHEYQVVQNGEWTGTYAPPRRGASSDFRLLIGDQPFVYQKVFGPSSIREVPGPNVLWNVLQLQPDGTIWYLGATDPNMTPPYPAPPKSQPAGFPLLPTEDGSSGKGSSGKGDIPQ